MSYLVLARKYRPQTFEDVVGQSHVTTTIANAVMSGRLAHAILFSGPRGTGKTTVARILAKTVNCEKNRAVPSAVPCNTCRSCMEITSGSAVDVFEIDGASNNSVDQIRDLRDNVRYMPAHSPFKIYIIDEVHMLSLAAFNALLKTLEEPPAHVKFLFATTEVHKIPITILSRCQRHDMRRVDLDQVAAHLKSLCGKEGVDIEDRSLSLIASESGGSVRDSLSLLDQVISSGTGAVSHDQVLDILGTVDRKHIFDMADAMLARDIPKVLDLIDDIYDRGHDLKKLYSRLTEHFRNLLVIRLSKDSTRLVDVPSHELGQMRDQVKSVSHLYLTQILDALFAEESRIRFASQPRFAIEIALIKILQIAPALSIDTLIEKLDQLQAGIPITEPAASAISYPQTRMNTESHINEAAANYNVSPAQPSWTPEPDTPASPESRYQTNTATRETAQNQPGYNPSDSPGEAWASFLAWFGTINAPLAPSLGQSSLIELSDQTVKVEIKGTRFSIQRVLTDKNKDAIQEACRQFFRTKASLTLVPNYGDVDANRLKKERNDQIKKETLSHPVVSEAVKVFEGNVDIKILQENEQ